MPCVAPCVQPHTFLGTTSGCEWWCEPCSSEPPEEERCLLLTHSWMWSWVSQQVDLANHLDMKSHKEPPDPIFDHFFFFFP